MVAQFYRGPSLFFKNNFRPLVNKLFMSSTDVVLTIKLKSQRDVVT